MRRQAVHRQGICPYHDLGLPSLQNREKHTCCLEAPQGYGVLLQMPRLTKTDHILQKASLEDYTMVDSIFEMYSLNKNLSVCYSLSNIN